MGKYIHVEIAKYLTYKVYFPTLLLNMHIPTLNNYLIFNKSKNFMCLGFAKFLVKISAIISSVEQ